MSRPIVFAALAAILPAIAFAQGHGMMSAGVHSAGIAPRMVAPAPRSVAPAAASGMRIVARGSAPHARIGTPHARNNWRPVATLRRHNDEGFFGHRSVCSNVPGLGFDFSHLAAVCGPGAVNFGGGFQSPLFFPGFESGFIVPSVPMTEEAAVSEAQQPEQTEADTPEKGRRARISQPEAPAVETANAALRETDEFIFVRRDGTVFFAVAYAWENGALRYVTNEGLRRSVAKDALDLDATQQFNEQRGLNFRLPA